MTYLDLTAIHFLKQYKKLASDNDELVNLIYIVHAIKRQPNRVLEIISNDSNSIIVNISKYSKKYKFFLNFIAELKNKKLFSEGLEIIAFLCWYTFFHIDFKSFQKNTLDKLIDKTISEFKDWYKQLNSNLHIIHGFKKSCNTILDLRTSTCESALDCLNRLIESDKISEVYYTGGITPYFLAAIPKRKIKIPKSAIFSSKLFSLIDQNKEILISKLNYASKNYLKVPIDSISYLNALQYVKA